MKVTFKNLRYKNILSTGNHFTEIDFQRNRTTLISGRNGGGKCVRGDTVVTVRPINEEVDALLSEFLGIGESLNGLTATVLDIVEFFNEYHEKAICGLEVETRFGWKYIEWAGVTAINSRVVRMELEDGSYLEGSPDHKIHTPIGWVSLTELMVGDLVDTVNGKIPVTSLAVLDERENLYDFQVSEVKEYYTNGIVSHNSTMIEALVFGLYGKPFRKINKPQLVNSINGKDLVVEVEFDVGDSSYMVRRGIKPNILEVFRNGTLMDQDAASKDYQEMLEKQILGISYKSFTQIVILGSATYTPFMDLSTPARREIIEDLLDIQVFSTMNVLVKDRASKNKELIKDLTHELTVIRTKIEALQDQQEALTKSRDDEIARTKAKAKDTYNLLMSKQSELEISEKTLTDLYGMISDKATVENRRSKMKEIRRELNGKIDAYKEDIEFYTSNEHCPTCRQCMDKKFIADIIEKRGKSLDEVTSALDVLNSKMEANEERIRDIREVEESIAASRSIAASITGEISHLKRTLRDLKQEMEEREEIVVDTSAISDLEAKKMSYEEDLTTAHLDKETIAQASILLKDTGIKANMIKQFVPTINMLINKYLETFELFVDFQLDENFNETILSRHRDNFSYSSFSEGEKMRINMAILMTWRAISKMRNSITTNLLIMDEILDGPSDSYGVEALVKIIDMISNDSNVFVVSHRGELFADYFDGHLNFVKEKNFSNLTVLS